MTVDLVTLVHILEKSVDRRGWHVVDPTLDALCQRSPHELDALPNHIVDSHKRSVTRSLDLMLSHHEKYGSAILCKSLTLLPHVIIGSGAPHGDKCLLVMNCVRHLEAHKDEEEAVENILSFIWFLSSKNIFNGFPSDESNKDMLSLLARTLASNHYLRNAEICRCAMSLLARLGSTQAACREQLIDQNFVCVAFSCMHQHEHNLKVLTACLEMLTCACDDERGLDQILALDGVETVLSFMKQSPTLDAFRLQGMKMMQKVAQTDRGITRIDGVAGAWSLLVLKRSKIQPFCDTSTSKKDEHPGCDTATSPNKPRQVTGKEVLWKAVTKYQTKDSTTTNCEHELGEMMRNLNMLPKKEEASDEWVHRTGISKGTERLVWKDHDDKSTPRVRSAPSNNMPVVRRQQKRQQKRHRRKRAPVASNRDTRESHGTVAQLEGQHATEWMTGEVVQQE